uniref:glycosyltransferase family 2 protein n=1 Tax=uncultured Dysgonomonas sp. TaxID=206096 RepID=UPI00262B167C|nr:glycosyltransferase family 2 protein [uncultured Dysgonomonas sp.]
MKISIITATYNSEKYLRDTIESILKQDYSNIEYIIVDGGSKDSTIDIIRECEPRFKGRLRWISEPDKGLYDALNKGFKIATGEIVGILNSDDFFTNDNVISEVVHTFKTNNSEAVYGDIHFVDAKNLNKCIRYYSSSIFRRSLMRIGFMPAHPTFYVYKNKFDELGYYKTDYKIAADFELLLRFIYVNKIKIKYLPLDFVTMRIGGMSTESMGSRKTIMREHIRAFKENGISNNRFILSLRYPYKIWELLKAKLS